MTPVSRLLLAGCACGLLSLAAGCAGDGNGDAPARVDHPYLPEARSDGPWDRFVWRLQRARTLVPSADPVTDAPPVLTFPDTLCGTLVGRLLECEIERVQAQKTLRDSEKASVITHKRRTFARKRDQYLSHCEGRVAGLPPQAVRACLPQPCVEMDRCLQKIAGQTNPK